MADTQTPNIALVKPEVGGSTDTWGNKWNSNADTLDTEITGAKDAHAAHLIDDTAHGMTATGRSLVRAVDAAAARTAIGSAASATNLTAGNGLLGGGSLTDDRAFALGTPTTCSGSTTNGVTTQSHTHALLMATQGEAEGGTNPATIMSPLRTRQAINYVLATAAAGAVGTYAFLGNPDATATAYTFGSTYPGSSLHPTGFREQGTNSTGTAYGPTIPDIRIQNSVRSGTWRCMGASDETATRRMKATLFLRIA
jgi:hypothetical protein